MDRRYVCACGLTCCDCLFYRTNIYEAAKDLKRILDETKVGAFLSILSKEEVNAAVADHLDTNRTAFYANFRSFQKLPEFLEVLNSLIDLQCTKTCPETGGCSMCGTTKSCVTIQCVQEKKLNGCWECEGNEVCEKLAFQRMSYGKTIKENFKIIREKGIEAVPSRGDDYYEWQRRLRTQP